MAQAAGIIAAMQIGKMPATIGDIRSELLLSLVLAGWVISCFNITSALFGALTGVVVDHLGYRRTLLAGMACLIVGNLLGYASASDSILLLARIIEGVGFVSVVIAAPALIANVTAPADRAFAMALWSAYMPTGMAIMLLLTPMLLTMWGWRSIWLANALLIALFSALFVFMTRHLATSAPQPRKLADLAVVITRPGPGLLAACFAVYALQWHALMAWLPTLLTETSDYSTQRAAVWVALIVAINIVGNVSGGYLLKYGITRWQIILTANILISFIVLGLFSDSITLFLQITLACLFSMVCGVIPAAIMAGIPAHAPSPAHIGATNGVIVQGSNIGTLFGPPLLASLVAMLGSWQYSGWLLFVICCAAGMVLALCLRQHEKDR